MGQPKLREAQFVLLQCIPMRWKKYRNKKHFSLDENQIDKNALLENLNLWGKTSLDFCWQKLVQQQPVRAEWNEYFSFYVESFLEKKTVLLNISRRENIKDKTMLFSLPENSKADYGGVEQNTNRELFCVWDIRNLILNLS